MDHITNNTSEDVRSDLIVTKGTTAKKKSKKTKDTNQNLSNITSNNALEIIQGSLNSVNNHSTNKGLPNGVAKDHDSDTEIRQSDTHNKENEMVNNCERLASETDSLAERINAVDLSQTTGSNVTNCESVSSVSESETEPKSEVVRCPECDDDNCTSPDSIVFESYKSELQMGEIMRLIQKDLSEPYSIYTYRYFIHNWPKLCFLAMHNKRCIGAIVCKLDLHRKVKRGYIAMLAVDEKYRKRKIGSHLVRQAITAMVTDDADEVVLETEITNKPALRLYGNLGFVRDKRLFRYYLNGVDALRLKLWLR